MINRICGATISTILKYSKDKLLPLTKSDLFLSERMFKSANLTVQGSRLILPTGRTFSVGRTST